MESVELKHYTVAQVRQWLQTGEPVDNLSPMVIAPARAWSIVHNPYIQDEDPCVAVIFVDKKVAAYTAAFPEIINEERKWWFSTLWCDPMYRGKGYGLILIGSLAEKYGIDNCLDCNAAKETIEVFTFLEHQTIYTKRYIFTVGRYDSVTIKGKILCFIRQMQMDMVNFFTHHCTTRDYTIKYLTNIDNRTYDFLRKHRKKDLFMHTQEILNWELHYPFTVSAPLINRTSPETVVFTSYVPQSCIYAVQVLENSTMIGFYMLKHCGMDMHVIYLYYDDTVKEKVFISIQDHIKHLAIYNLLTDDIDLAEFIRTHIYFPKTKVAKISLSCPKSIKLPSLFTTQLGDGDGWT